MANGGLSGALGQPLGTKSSGSLAIATAADITGTNTTASGTTGTRTITVASATGIATGQTVTGTGIPVGTTVTAVTGTTITLSANLTATITAQPVAFFTNTKTVTPGGVGSQLCRAWVNFNGTGAVAIRSAFNVSSITDNGVGDYTVNFATPMTDANYSVVAACTQRGGGGSPAVNVSVGFGSTASNNTDGTYSTTGVQIFSQGSNGGVVDRNTVTVAVFR
jgi:hypothetical protein